MYTYTKFSAKKPRSRVTVIVSQCPEPRYGADKLRVGFVDGDKFKMVVPGTVDGDSKLESVPLSVMEDMYWVYETAWAFTQDKWHSFSDAHPEVFQTIIISRGRGSAAQLLSGFLNDEGSLSIILPKSVVSAASFEMHEISLFEATINKWRWKNVTDQI